MALSEAGKRFKMLSWIKQVVNGDLRIVKFSPRVIWSDSGFGKSISLQG